MLQQLIVDGAGLKALGLKLLWNPNDQWNMDALLIEPLLAAVKSLTVIAEEEDDRLVVEPLLLQPLDHLPHFHVKVLGRIEV